jgi:aryl-alcohol dehydrogenase-like predicted oxidoreductase
VGHRSYGLIPRLCGCRNRRIGQAVWRNGQAPLPSARYVSGMPKQVILGSQGLSVPAIGLGCMGMSDFYGASSEAQNLGVLERAAAIGCTFWDTSDIYGPFTNEILLSKALKGRRPQITLATKFGVVRGEDGSWQGVRGSADYVKTCCDASLKRLGTDYIDLYYQHRVDPKTPIEETVGAMADLVKAGKVRYIGLSEADPETLARAHAVHPVSALQTEYSVWTREVEGAILPTVRRLDIGFVAYSPLGRGFLSGAIRTRSDLQPGDWRLQNPRFSEAAIARNSGLAEVVSSLAKEVGATPAQVALAWVLSRDPRIAAIPGTRKLERLEENWAAQEVTLRADQLERLDTLVSHGVAGERY